MYVRKIWEYVCARVYQLKLNCALRNMCGHKAAVGNSLTIRDGVGVPGRGNRKRTVLREKMCRRKRGGRVRSACARARNSVTNDTTIRYLRDRDTCLEKEVFPCSFALELQHERASERASGAFGLFSDCMRPRRFSFFALYNSPFPFPRAPYHLRRPPPTISRSELKNRRYVLCD